MIFLKVMPFSRERLLGSIWDWKFEQPKTTVALENLFCRDKYYPSSVGAHRGCGHSGGFIYLFIYLCFGLIIFITSDLQAETNLLSV